MKHSLVTSTVLLLAGIVIGGGGVYFVHTTTLAFDTTSLEHTGDGSSSKDTARMKQKPTPPLNFSDDFQSLDSLNDPTFDSDSAKRKFAIYSFVSTLSSDQLLAALDATLDDNQSNTSRLNTDLQTALVEKLAAVNPLSVVEYAVEYDTIMALPANRQMIMSGSRPQEEQPIFMPTVRGVFADWAVNDLGAAMNAAKKLDRDAKSNALAGVLTAQTGESLSTYREIARELGDAGEGERYYVSSFMSKEIDDPQSAWTEVLKLAQNSMTEYGFEPFAYSALVTIARQWYKKDGFSAFDTMYGSELVDNYVLGVLLGEVAVDNPAQALQYALKVPDESGYHSAAHSVIETWAATDPKAAYDAVSNIEKSGTREQLYSTVGRTWAEKEPRYILKNLEEFAVSQQYTLRSYAISSLARSNPLEAAELVLENSDNPDYSNLPHQVIPMWFEQDIDSAINWVYNGPMNKKQRSNWVRAVTSNLTRTDPRRAFDLALQEDIPEGQSFYGRTMSAPGLEADVIRQIVYQDFDLALELLPKVRAGTTKTQASIAIGDKMIDQGDSKKAVNLGLELPATEHAVYFEGIARTWARIDPAGLVESLSSLPTEDIRSSIAGMIANRWTREQFTDEQFEVFKQYLSEEQRKRLED